jgi:hypothetical protein
MKSFWRHGDRLERDLRANRPEPSADFMQALESKVAGKAYRRPGRPIRLGLAAALTAGMLVAVGAFGGFSYAATGVSHAVTAATHVVAPAHHAAPALKRTPLTSAQAQYLVAMCFLRHTIYVDSHAVRILERLGATVGPCKGGRRTPPAATTIVCVKGTNVRVTLADAAKLIKANKAKKGFCKK